MRLNVADGLAGNGIEIKFRFRRDFASHNHKVTLGISLACYAAIWVLGQAGIQHGIGNGIADFVRMALADGLRRKDVIFAHVCLS